MTQFDIELQILICKREAYIAENQNRLHRGEVMAFDYDPFMELSQAFNDLLIRWNEYQANLSREMSEKKIS